MTVRRGRCNNIGLCENATRQRTIEVAGAEPFVCPKCDTDLVSVSERKSTRTAGSMTLPAVVISLAVAAVAYEAWDIYGRPNAMPASQEVAVQAPAPMAAAAPEAPAAAAPAPAPAPTQIAEAAPAPAAAVVATDAIALSPAPEPSPAAPPVAAPPPAAPPALAAVAPPEPAPSVAPVPQDPAPATDPAARVQAFVGNAARVPITFTFRSSVVALGARSDRDLERLIGYLKQHHATGERVYLAGFTDNQGDPVANDAVSQKRVAAVAAALTEAGLTPGHLASFGSALPVADNATQAGRDRNRRVEVYLAP